MDPCEDKSPADAKKLPPGTAVSSDDNLSSSEKSSKEQRTDEEKKMDRILANRRSARMSRERRKKLQENLEVSYALLNKHNQELLLENEILKKELDLLIRLQNQGSHGSILPMNSMSTDNVVAASAMLRNQGNPNNASTISDIMSLLQANQADSVHRNDNIMSNVNPVRSSLHNQASTINMNHSNSLSTMNNDLVSTLLSNHNNRPTSNYPAGLLQSVALESRMKSNVLQEVNSRNQGLPPNVDALIQSLLQQQYGNIERQRSNNSR